MQVFSHNRNAEIGLVNFIVTAPDIDASLQITRQIVNESAKFKRTFKLVPQTNVEIVTSFHDIVLSLQYQVFPTQQPVQQHTEEPTYEVGDEPCSTHSGRPRHLPTFQLTAGECPFLFLLSFFFFFYVISPRLVSGLLPSHAMESRVSRQPLRISGAMHASLASQHNTLPYFFSMLNQPTGMLWDMCLLHELMGNLALYFGVIAHGCVDGGMGGPLCLAGVKKKKI